MTCIVGIVDKNAKKVFIGGDSASVAGSSIFTRKDSKVFRNGDFVFGCTTSFRMIQLLQYSFKPPDKEEKDIYDYMCTDFIDKIRECFNNGGFLQKTTDGDERGGSFLVAYKDRLFKIDEDFQVIETLDGIDACGCGMDFALGAIYAISDNDIPIDDKIHSALKTAEYLSSAVRSPFNIMSTF